jgi:hypothetical protein
MTLWRNIGGVVTMRAVQLEVSSEFRNPKVVDGFHALVRRKLELRK